MMEVGVKTILCMKITRKDEKIDTMTETQLSPGRNEENNVRW